MRSISVVQSADELSQLAADTFARLSGEAVSDRGSFSTALSGGSTPRGAFKTMAGAPFRSQVQWDRIEFFWSDERHVPPDHSDSNYRMAFEALLSKVAVDEQRVHRIRGEHGEPAIEAERYESEIRATLGGHDDPPRFDLILLGVGTDGHTASLFPGTPALEEQRRLCVANWVPSFGSHRITMTLPLINAARHIMFIVSGQEKAQIVRQILEQPDPGRPLPSELVQPFDGHVTWLLDRAAASLLSKTIGQVPKPSV